MSFTLNCVLSTYLLTCVVCHVERGDDDRVLEEVVKHHGHLENPAALPAQPGPHCDGGALVHDALAQILKYTLSG